MTRHFRDVTKRDDWTAFHQRKLKLELRLAAGDAGVENQNFGPDKKAKVNQDLF